MLFNRNRCFDRQGYTGCQALGSSPNKTNDVIRGCNVLYITTLASDDEIESRLVAIGVVAEQAGILANKRVEVSR